MEAKTWCQDCVFASKKGECDLDRHEKFEKNGATITKDDEGNAIVNDRWCSAFRREKWKKGKDVYNLPIIVRAELLISNEVLVYINDDNYSEEKLVKTLDSLKSQLLKPNLVVLVVNKTSANYHQIIKVAKNSGLKYRVDRIMPEDDGTLIHELDALDIAAKKIQSDYYLIMCVGAVLEDDEFFANIDEALNENLLRFSVILPNDEGRGLFLSSILSKKLNGNVPMSSAAIDEENGSKDVVFNSLKEKIDYLANKDNHHFLIKKYEEIKSGK